MIGDLLRLVLTGLVAAGLVAGTVLVHRPQSPEAGLEALPAAEGRVLFLAKGCNACHALEGFPGRSAVGPDLSGLAAVADSRRPGMSAEAYVRESIREPQAFIAPGFGGRFVEMPALPLTDAEVEALVSFLLEER